MTPRAVAALVFGILALVVAVATVVYKVGDRSGRTVRVVGSYDESRLADGFDYALAWRDGTWTVRSHEDLGTLEDAALGDRTDDDDSPGLDLVKTVCYGFDQEHSATDFCVRTYQMNDKAEADEVYDLRVAWITGSSTARGDATLTEVRHRLQGSGFSLQFIDWQPGGTDDQAKPCHRGTHGVSIAFVSVGVTKLDCARFGLTDVDAKAFAYEWAGEADAETPVELEGSTTYEFYPGDLPRITTAFSQEVCVPSWAPWSC